MQAVEKLETKSLPQQWCMLLVTPGKEQHARDSFHRYGVQAYWPNYYSFLRSNLPLRERRRTDYRSVIPGYLFLKSVLDNQLWETIQRTKDTNHLVLNYSGSVATLKEESIDVIRAIEGGMHTLVPGKSLHNFKTGDKVRFVDDLQGRWPPGRISGAVRDGRITVEVRVMGRMVPFQVFPHQIGRFA